MPGQSTQTEYKNTHQVSGPEQWMKTQGQAIFNEAEAKTPQEYQQYGGERVADYGVNWDKAQGLIQGMAGSTNQDYGSARSVLSSLVSSDANDPNKTVSDYIHPYVAGTLAPTLRNLDEARQRAGIQTGFAATQSGAFGDAQHGVAASLGNRDYMNSVGDATSRAYSDAYDKGLTQQNTVMARLAQLPGMFQSLGGAEDNRTLQSASALDSLAQQSQQLQQARDNVAYSDFTAKNNYGMQRASTLMDLLNNTPHDTTTDATSYGKTTKEDNSGLQAVAGLATKALGSIFGAGGFGTTALGAILSK